MPTRVGARRTAGFIGSDAQDDRLAKARAGLQPGMSTAADDPSRHLLTRTDLARLEAPDARVDEWLAAGSLEQVGTITAESGADPVFAVHAVELRAELHELLVALGKANAALGPVQARSQLLRVLLAERGIDDGDAGAAEAAVETGAVPPAQRHDD